ncbi:MAG: HAD-IC family P-type ATPase [bacterium]|nr:HAD-IC family P-type ATPase [bacterium]
MPHQGLDKNEVEKLKEKFGENSLPIKKPLSVWMIFFSQFKSPLIYILFFVGLISLFFKEYIDAGLIVLVGFFNALLGFFQEYNSQKTLVALRNIIKPKALVIRNGHKIQIEAKDLVPGDLVVIGSGDKIPADGELIEGLNLLVNEAILTGEDEAVAKKPTDNANKLFMGTIVIWGNGIMKINKIGQETEIGKIGSSISEVKETKTPIQVALDKFAKNLLFIIFIICSIIFITGILHQENFWEIFRTSIVLATAAIPEGLPIAITIILTLGMKRVLIKKGLVRRLLSIETLGSTSVICVDKTGTLTEGIMKVVKSDFSDNNKAFLALTLVNNQRMNLEIALWDYVKKQKLFDPHQIFNEHPRIYEEPFDSEKKYALSINKINNKDTAFILGAPEIVLSFCHLSAQESADVLKKIDIWASKGWRILGVAFKEDGKLKEKKGYAWLGLVGIEDPLRYGAKEAIEQAMQAGIKIKIITGDHSKTAEKVAKNLGFKIGPNNILSGNELGMISSQELKDRIDEIVLFSRVLPHQKLKIVTALQAKGEITAMTGDGVNDAPALKKADIGVVMGSGTEVAKEVGDLILLDNNFKTIITAIEEGRLIFSNIRKVVSYVLSNSFVEIILIFGAILLNSPLPLTIVQILWIQLVCDGPPNIILGFEPKEKDLMKEKPRNHKKDGILTRASMFLVIAVSSSIGLLTLFLFLSFYHRTNNLILAQTIVFATVATVSLVYIFSFKNLTKPLFKINNFFGNKYLLWGVLYGFVLVFAALYIPFLNKILGTTPLNLFHWLIILTIAIISTLIIEIFKFFTNKNSE